MATVIMLLLAQIATPADIPKKALYTEQGEKVLCKLVTEAYSRIPTRICRTERQWGQIAYDNEQAMNQSSKNTSSVGFNDGWDAFIKPPH